MAVEENSELDLLVAYNKRADDPRIPAKMAEMPAELGGNNKDAGVLPRLAQYELDVYKRQAYSLFPAGHVVWGGGETAYLPACFKPIHEKTGGKSWGIFV